MFVLAFMNSTPALTMLKILNPTINLQIADIVRLPLPSRESTASFTGDVPKLIEISKQDWDNLEASWDFQTFPLLHGGFSKVSEAFEDWNKKSDEAFYELKRLEEENNRYWIPAYGLGDELSPDVPEEQITIRRADCERDVRLLISYAVGCMFGRYSLLQPGLQFAGGTFDTSALTGNFLPDRDGIVPVTDAAYFEDDIVNRFREFLKVAFGERHVQENLEFVASALDKRGSETAMECIRRYFVDEFVHDHIRTYSKRPIYWLFTSGKHNAFGAFIYLHRYTPDTLPSLRNNYVLPMQSKLAAEIRDAEAALAGATVAREKQIKAGSRQDKLELIKGMNPKWQDLYEKISP
jgi:hypothetical protein